MMMLVGRRAPMAWRRPGSVLGDEGLGIGLVDLRGRAYVGLVRLIPLKKKYWGVRLIALADTLRRLTATWLLATCQGRSATAALAQLQTAFAKGSTCELVAMGVQALADTLQGSTRWLLLQVDLKNAFKSIHQPAILNALEQRCPSMLPWVHQAFQPAPLLMGRDVI